MWYKQIYSDTGQSDPTFHNDNQPVTCTGVPGLYGTFQDQGTTCVSRQSDANFFISKRAETLNFFAPLRMMAGPIYHAKKPAWNWFFCLFLRLVWSKNGVFCLFFCCACKTVFFIVNSIPIKYLEAIFFLLLSRTYVHSVYKKHWHKLKNWFPSYF